MAIRINNETYYRTSEACQRAGISKPTLFRWLRTGIIEDVARRDRKEWRLFTEDEVKILKAESNRVIEK